MYARVATYSIDGDRIEAAVDAFNTALDRIRTLDGFIDGQIMVAPDDSKVLSVTYWESRAAMASSSVTASRARSEAARAADGEVESSCEYRVAVRISDQESELLR